MTQPKFVIGFNFDSVDFPGKTLGASGVNEFKHKDLLIGGAQSLYIARFVDGEVKAGADPIFQQEAVFYPLDFYKYPISMVESLISYGQTENLHAIFWERTETLYTLGKPLSLGSTTKVMRCNPWP